MSAPVPTGLVPRPYHVEAARLIDAGESLSAIAEKLGVSRNTIQRALTHGPVTRPSGRPPADAPPVDLPRPRRRPRAHGETQRMVVESIRDDGPAAVMTLSKRLDVHVSQVVQIVAGLEVRGVLVRGEDRLARFCEGGLEIYATIAAAGRRGLDPQKARGPWPQARDEEQRLRTRVLIVALEREALAADAYREAVRLSQWGLQQHHRGEVLAAQAEARTAAGEAARVGVDVAREVEAWRARVAAGGMPVERGATARLGGHR